MLIHGIAGFGYTFFNEKLRDYSKPVGYDELSGDFPDILQPLVHQPGEGWEYGVSIDWAGILLERATGQSLNDYMHKNIFEPLGLKNISMFPNEDMKKNLAYMNRRAPDGQLSPSDHLFRRPLIVNTADEVKNSFNSGGAGCFAKPQEYCSTTPCITTRVKYTDINITSRNPRNPPQRRRIPHNRRPHPPKIHRRHHVHQPNPRQARLRPPSHARRKARPHQPVPSAVPWRRAAGLGPELHDVRRRDGPVRGHGVVGWDRESVLVVRSREGRGGHDLYADSAVCGFAGYGVVDGFGEYHLQGACLSGLLRCDEDVIEYVFNE